MIISPRALLFLLLTSSSAAALTPEPSWLRDGQQAFDLLVQEQALSYREMDQAFIDARSRAPDDAELAAAHCDLFWRVWDIEGLSWADDAYSRHAECLETLESRLPDAPEVKVLLAEQDSDEARDRSALALWDESQDWPVALRIRLARVLAASDHIGPRAGDFAIEAVRLGDATQLPAAIRRLNDLKGSAAAAKLAAAAPLAENSWQLDARLKALSELDSPTAARSELARHETTDIQASLPVVVNALLKAGDFAALKARLDESEADEGAIRAARLALAVASEDPKEALANFELDFDDFEALARDYFSILGLNPLLAFAPTMLPLTLVWMLVALAMLLAPMLLLVPVHYRGLARRLAGHASAPLLPGLGLRHAWYALGVCLLLLPTLVLAIVSPYSLGEMLAGNDQIAASITVMLWASVGSILALLPTLYWLRRPHWIVPRAEAAGMFARVILAYAVGVCVVLACVAVEKWLSTSGVKVETSTFQETLFEQGMARYGFALTLLTIGVLVPIVEEWVFRGLLLGGLSKHIHFGWANLLQASLFTLIHDDTMRFPFYFAIGLMAGWLVKRYRSLMPAVILHILNNSVAVWLHT